MWSQKVTAYIFDCKKFQFSIALSSGIWKIFTNIFILQHFKLQLKVSDLVFWEASEPFFLLLKVIISSWMLQYISTFFRFSSIQSKKFVWSQHLKLIQWNLKVLFESTSKSFMSEFTEGENKKAQCGDMPEINPTWLTAGNLMVIYDGYFNVKNRRRKSKTNKSHTQFPHPQLSCTDSACAYAIWTMLLDLF